MGSITFVASFAYSPCISIAYLTARADGHVIARRTWNAACVGEVWSFARCLVLGRVVNAITRVLVL